MTMTRKNLLDRLRKHKRQKRIAYFAPHTPGSPHPKHWIGDGQMMDSYEDFLSWAVSRSVINGNDRTQLLAEVPKTVVAKPKTDGLDTTLRLLEDHTQLLRQAIDRLPNPEVGYRSVLRILLGPFS